MIHSRRDGWHGPRAMAGTDRALENVDRYSWWIFAGLGAMAFCVLLFLGRHGTFYGDEWRFIRLEGFGRPDDWLRPWNSHPSAVPLIVYRAIFLIVGLHSYIPYLSVLLALHVVAAAALFLLIRQASGSLPALCGAAMFLFLGSGFQNLFWAFQIGFVGSTAAGLWALALLSQRSVRSRATGAALTLVSVASSGMGLAFLAAAAADALADSPRRREVLWLVPTAAIAVLWFLVWGRSGIETPSSAAGHAPGSAVAMFATVGPIASIRGLWGLGLADWGLYALAGLVTVRNLVERRPQPRVLASAAGLAVMFGLIGLTRGAYGLGTTNQPRYVYEAAAFALLGASALIGRGADALSNPRDLDWTAKRTLLVAGTILLTIVGLVRNIQILPGGAAFFADAAGELRATLALVDRYGGRFALREPVLVDRFYVPSPAVLSDAIAAGGRPDVDVFRPTLVLPPTAEESDRALWRLIGGNLQPVATLPPASRAPPHVTAMTGAVLSLDRGCLTIGINQTSAQTSLTIRMAEGEAIAILGSVRARWSVGLGRDAPPQAVDTMSVLIGGTTWQEIRTPTLGDQSVFQLLLLPPVSSGDSTICSAEP